jgi:hypothetical protein
VPPITVVPAHVASAADPVTSGPGTE